MKVRDILADLVEWRDEVTLVPHSGIQMLDFGFSLDALDVRPARFVERRVGGSETEDQWVLIPLSGDAETDETVEQDATSEDDEYAVRPVAALEPYLSKWVPVPVLRIKTDRGPGGEERFDPGPTAWARMRTVELDEPDPKTGHTHRVQIAFDTNLAAEASGLSYLAPERADAEKSRAFRFVSDPAQMDWFVRRVEADRDGAAIDLQKWVSDWLEELFLSQKRAERPGRVVTADTLPHKFEHWARYLAYLRLMDAAVRVPSIRLANTVSARDAVAPVEVELVLDIGNSRTCGILIERFPGQSQADLVRSYPLEIRDLSAPEFLYSGLFASRVEFAEHRMGDERYASRSGRRNAFLWPSVVRTGPEALRLVADEEGTETASGLSSPKRYLWDADRVQQDWRFHHHSDPNALPKALRAAMRHLNEDGDMLAQVAEDVAAKLTNRREANDRPAIRPRFARSSLFGFMLAELIAHAMVQVNAPAGRARRQQSELPRRLSRIILTLPTATTAQEQAIIRSKANGALKLVWQMLGLEGGESSLARSPKLIVEWDEASCTQLVYLYSELNQKFDGRIDQFLDLKGRPRPRSDGRTPEPSLRLACIDIGGGTTDLMVTTYWGEAGRVLHPQQTFREGFRVAGDDLLQRIIATLVLPGLQAAIETAGGRFVAERMRELFSGDVGGLDQQIVQRRRQFSHKVLVPLAVAMLKECETADPNIGLSIATESVLALAPRDGEDGQGDTFASYLEDAARELGAADFALSNVVLNFSREDVDAIAREVLQRALSNLGEVIDHLGVDVVLLTGRPSRLPAVRAILEELMAVPPHRLVSMHSYKTGGWYPFRDPVTHRIGDPKSTVAVGGMLIALAEGRIPNFKVSTQAFRMASTARYIGEMDRSGQITDDRLLFKGVDLDGGRAQDMEAQLRMDTPLHLGARQLPLERWTTTPLYRLDFATDAAAARAPLFVTFERDDVDDDPDNQTAVTVLRREVMREAFRVTGVEDTDGAGKPGEVSLRLHTLGFDDEYWIDTGLFRV